ncbi:MAG TPA: sterol desaturase family protein [Vicinamibacteria bacterium]|nr:sterol desaturase family protein [Vicinamibacteria bacterium]
MSYVVLAIPVFFLLIGLELIIARLQEKDYYSLSDSFADLGCGLIDQLVEVGIKTFLFAGYLLLYERWRLFDIPATSAAAWVGCLLGVDFLYYWFHRKSHEVNAFWAAHVVHHQSEEYNLAVALRQGAFQGAFSWVFYLPLALLGFPPLMFLAVSSVDTLYQFWIHTRAIGKLGPLEWVLNTPSNHRVHHGRNPKYVDRNHGAIFIVWDRLFGTYAAEQEEPVYGITTPLRSWNPVWANLHYWAELGTRARRTARRRDKLRLFLERPGWQPDDLGGFQAPPEVDRATVRKFTSAAPASVQVYAAVQFTVALLLGTAFLFRQASWPAGQRWLTVAFVVATLATCAALMEGRRWAVPLEMARLAAAVPLVHAAALMNPVWAPAALVAAAAVAASLWLVKTARPLTPMGLGVQAPPRAGGA